MLHLDLRLNFVRGLYILQHYSSRTTQSSIMTSRTGIECQSVSVLKGNELELEAVVPETVRKEDWFVTGFGMLRPVTGCGRDITKVVL